MSFIKYGCWREFFSAKPRQACKYYSASCVLPVPLCIGAVVFQTSCFSTSRSNYCKWRRLYKSLGGAPVTLAASIRSCAEDLKAGEGRLFGERNGRHDAEELLRDRFGPQAKVLLRRCEGPRHRRLAQEVKTTAAVGTELEDEEEGVVIEDDEPVARDVLQCNGRVNGDAGKSSFFPELAVDYRASATCRLLGFPVELAAAKGHDPDVVVNQVVQDALASDVIFILPQAKTLTTSQAYRNNNRGRQKRVGHSRHAFLPQLSPRQMELKAIIDELRELCVHFSRVLKFSIKKPQEGCYGQGGDGDYNNDKHGDKGGSAMQRRWSCRAYVRDEWGMAPSLTFTGQVCGESANDSLMRCFAMLRDRYRAELESPLVQLESVREVEAFVRPWGKTIESHCFEESVEEPFSASSAVSSDSGQKKEIVNSTNESDVSEQTEETMQTSIEEQYKVLRPKIFTAAVIVEDAYGNISVNQVKRQITPLAAYQNASGQAFRSEASLLPDITITDQCISLAPLLIRMRWQFDAMVQRLAERHGMSSEEFASIRIEGDNCNAEIVDMKEESVFNNNSNDNNNDNTNKKKGFGIDSSRNSSAGSVPGDKQSVFFTVCFILDGSVVWQQTGLGRYRLEFDCYVQALTYLLDKYPDIGRMYFDARGGGVLFPSTQLLQLAVMKHDNYNIASNHRGKWNAYALLGTVTSQLIGSFYQTTYKEDRSIGEARATLTVNDGLNSKQLLIQRQAKKRGEAWRMACLDALRMNFPNQYRDALLLHPDIDLSADTMARGSKYRALPREKRVEHIGNIFSLVAAFAEEDLGWHNLRVRLRNASGDLGLPQWVAEMEAQIEGEDQRRVVAISPPYSQVKHARRVLVYQLAKKYFPKELEAYAKLNRGDAANPDNDARNFDNVVYRAGTESFVNQVIVLLEEQAPAMAPYSWSLEQYVDSNSVEYDGGNDGSLEYLLRPFKPRFRAAVYGQSGDVLISERIGDEDEGAVNVLCSVLRAATNNLAGDKGEQLWTEYECHAPPPVSTSRELALYMFNAFFGVSKLEVQNGEGLLSANMEQQVVDIEARELSGYWFVTLSLLRVGGLAVERAISTAKREGINDVLLLACRKSFPRVLHYLSSHSKEMSSFAVEILSAPVVEALPTAVLRDIQRSLEKAENAGPPRPYTLLRRCVTRDFYNERWLRVEQLPNSGSGFQCRIYLQKKRRESKKGEVQLVGFGSALSRSQALHIASICALENLFEADLAEAVARSPTYKDLPLPD